jgi:predicted KAP-like P-loop ATPase
MAQTVSDNQPRDNRLTNPQTDRLGYASFAQHLADCICKMNFAETFAIAVYGPWGSGKSTLLNFVLHYLEEKPDEEQPIIVPFNPWLFSGYQDITRRFFDQLQNVISKTTYVPKGLKERIADFAKVVGEIPLPYAQTGKAVATLFDDNQKEASDLKEEVEYSLGQQQRRIVVAIDDIDKLEADDIKKLFDLLKAIPNFTNIVYLLVFDEKVVLQSLADVQEVSPEEYLRKIIQVAFEIPSVDKTSLRRLFFEKLDDVLTDTPQELLEPTYWSNVYFDGIDYFINSLRDITRLIDNLTVTYPIVKGEVNPVDFIAVETLRVFCPTVYEIIHKNKNYFLPEVNSSLEELKSFHNSWIAEIKDKDPVKKILTHLFPTLAVIWSNSSCTEKEELQCHKQRRICSLEIFPIYFRLTISENELPETQLKAILTLACDAPAFGEKLIELANQRRCDGMTQLRTFLEKLEDYSEKEIPTPCISSIVQALLNVGEQLLCPEDEPNTMFGFGNRLIIRRIISKLLCRLDNTARLEVLKTAVSQDKALSIIGDEIADN